MKPLVAFVLVMLIILVIDLTSGPPNTTDEVLSD